MFENETVITISQFLSSIGIDVCAQEVRAGTFLPGIAVQGGKLLVDESGLAYPGDLLHEGGHLALMPGAERQKATEAVEHPDPALWDVAVIAWSYAAALHLGIEPRVVFHPGGYRGQSEALLTSFSVGVYPGAALLAKLGLTHVGLNPGGPAYPKMVKWVRD